MLSIKLVNVGNTEDFWQPLVDILISSLQQQENTTATPVDLDFFNMTNMVYLMANLDQQASQQSLSTLLQLIDKDQDTKSRLIRLMKERMQQPEKRTQMPNLVSHLYWSLASLDFND